MSDFNRILALHAQQQWEITKGHLMATVKIVGATYSGDPKKLDTIHEKVREFIEDIEGWERHLP